MLKIKKNEKNDFILTSALNCVMKMRRKVKGTL